MKIHSLLKVILYFGILMFSSCEKMQQNSASGNLLSKRDSIAQNPRSGGPISAFVFPKNLSLVMPMVYRTAPYDYPKNINSKRWIELSGVSGEQQWKLSDVTLVVKNEGRDPCSGIETISVASENKNAVLFFTDFPGLNKDAKTLVHTKLLLPGQTHELVLADRTYQFVVKGKAYAFTESGSNEIAEYIFDEDGNANIDYIRDFEVVLRTPEGTDISVLKIKDIHDRQPKLIWAGDLNGDQIPDFFIDASDDYENDNYYFLLSDPEDPKNPVKKAAYLERVFDC